MNRFDIETVSLLLLIDSVLLNQTNVALTDTMTGMLLDLGPTWYPIEWGTLDRLGSLVTSKGPR